MLEVPNSSNDENFSTLQYIQQIQSNASNFKKHLTIFYHFVYSQFSNMVGSMTDSGQWPDVNSYSLLSYQNDYPYGTLGIAYGYQTCNTQKNGRVNINEYRNSEMTTAQVIIIILKIG